MRQVVSKTKYQPNNEEDKTVEHCKVDDPGWRSFSNASYLVHHQDQEEAEEYQEYARQ